MREREAAKTGLYWPVEENGNGDDVGMSLQVSLNGEAKEFPGPLTVEALLKQLALDPAKVAVERNLAIVPRSTYGAVMLASGDRLEIVHFIGGGNDVVTAPAIAEKPFVVAGRILKSRLIVGT